MNIVEKVNEAKKMVGTIKATYPMLPRPVHRHSGAIVVVAGVQIVIDVAVGRVRIAVGMNMSISCVALFMRQTIPILFRRRIVILARRNLDWLTWISKRQIYSR